MLLGEYFHNIDAKGRIILPSKFRSELGERFIVTKGFDGCLSVYNESEFQALCLEVNNISFNKKNSRSYLRIVLNLENHIELYFF